MSLETRTALDLNFELVGPEDGPAVVFSSCTRRRHEHMGWARCEAFRIV
jgi:hypothetical protein